MQYLGGLLLLCAGGIVVVLSPSTCDAAQKYVTALGGTTFDVCGDMRVYERATFCVREVLRQC